MIISWSPKWSTLFTDNQIWIIQWSQKVIYNTRYNEQYNAEHFCMTSDHVNVEYDWCVYQILNEADQDDWRMLLNFEQMLNISSLTGD